MGNASSYSQVATCAQCGAAFTPANPQAQCNRCERMLCRKHLAQCPWLACFPLKQCEGCVTEQERLTSFNAKLLPVLKEGGIFNMGGSGLFSRSVACWVQYDVVENTLTWKSMKLERNKPTHQGGLALPDMVGASKSGCTITVSSDSNASAVVFSADKDKVAELWEHGLSELIALKHAVLGQPNQHVERFSGSASRAAASASARAESLFKDVANEEAASKQESAAKKLSRLVDEAKAKKAKYAGVGMAHVAKAMVKRAMDA